MGNKTPAGFDRTVLVLNPNSRSGGGPVAEAMERLLELGPVHAWRASDLDGARAAIRDFGGPRTRVVLGGGDGTLSCLLDDVLESGSTLGVLPLGTANDFARSLHLPLDPVEAVAVIAAGHVRKVDVGEVNGETFLNAVGVGIGPEMTREMDSDTKSQLGVFAYPIALLSVLRETKPFRATIDIDGKQRVLECLQVTIGNGIHYGGGMTVSEEARMDNGELSVLCIRRQPAWQLAGHAIDLRQGHADEDGDIEIFSGRHVRLETDRELEATADGEPVTRTPLDCRCRARALPVFAPRDEPAPG